MKGHACLLRYLGNVIRMFAGDGRVERGVDILCRRDDRIRCGWIGFGYVFDKKIEGRKSNT